MRVLIVDNRILEAIWQWEHTECSHEHQLVPPEPFVSIEQVNQLVQTYQPDAILIGHGLGWGKPTGSDVICSLRNQGYTGLFIANSGDGTVLFEEDGVVFDAAANRSSQGLSEALTFLQGKSNEL